MVNTVCQVSNTPQPTQVAAESESTSATTQTTEQPAATEKPVHASKQYASETSYHPVASEQLARQPEPQAEKPNTGFAQSAKGTDPQWELDSELAHISGDVYNDKGTELDGGWERVSSEQLQQDGIDPASLQNESTGFQSNIYTDGEGRYVVAYAGTSSLSDWKNNIQQGLGANSEQYDQAIQVAQQAAEVYGKENIVFTGHSLGGGLASTAAVVVGDGTAVTFNAAGVHPNTLKAYGHDPSDVRNPSFADQSIRAYSVENDPLTALQDLTKPAMPPAIGHRIVLENQNFLDNEFQAHFMGSVKESMEAREVVKQEKIYQQEPTPVSSQQQQKLDDANAPRFTPTQNPSFDHYIATTN